MGFWLLLLLICCGVAEKERTLPLAQPMEVRGMVQSQIDRYELLLQNGHVEDAIRLITSLIDGDVSGVIRVDESRYVSLRDYCHRLIAQLPPSALAMYRQLVDPIAEAWYTDGKANRDQRLLRRVVDRAFCSHWGDDALLALGELALERADYQQARNAWLRLSPALWSPFGKSQNDKTSSRLYYPNSELDLAKVRAWLALVSIRAGEFERAQTEIDQLHNLHPHAHGYLGGKHVIYFQQLTDLLSQARQWPIRTEDAKQSLGSDLQKLWVADRGRGKNDRGRSLASSANIKDRQSNWSNTPSPKVVDDILLYGDTNQIHAVSVATGRPAFGRQSAIYAFEQIRHSLSTQPASAQVTQSLYITASGSQIFAVSGLAELRAFPSRTATPTNDRVRMPLVGIDLERDGALFFSRVPDENNWAFIGAPLVDRSRSGDEIVLVAVIEHDVRSRLWIACYHIGSQQRLWRRAICELGNLSNREPAKHLAIQLTLDAGIVYCNTNRGAVAAVRADDGQILWMRTYRRTVGSESDQSKYCSGRTSCTCLFYRGLLLLTPVDSSEMMALDAAMGSLVWARLVPEIGAKMVGAVDGKLVLSRERLWALDLPTGETVFGWGDETAGQGAQNDACHLSGQGVIAGHTIYWPMNHKLLTFDSSNGSRLGLSANLPEPCTTNLIATREYLVATGVSKIAVYKQMPSPANRTGDNKNSNAKPDDML